MQSNKARLIAAVFVVGFLLIILYSSQDTVNIMDYRIGIVQKPAHNGSERLMDTCILKALDPFDAETNKLLDYNFHPNPNCTVKFDMLTKLQNGTLYHVDHKNETQCWWQCLFPKADYHLTQGGWKRLTNGSVPECDVVETACFKDPKAGTSESTPDDENFRSKTYYEFLHAQVYRNDTPAKAEKPPQLDRPDVHIIVVDSVSHSQSVRALPKTRHILRKNLDAISFPYLNKVGLNSRPNGFAFLLGKNVLTIKKSALSVGYPHDCIGDYTCCVLLDNNNFIGFRYQEASYTTMMNEDCRDTVFAAGMYCRGYNNTPVDHYMRPYQLRVEDDKYTTLKLQDSIYRGACRESFMPQMEYLQDFIEKYSDKPKFTITWMTNLAHADNNELFHADDYFYNFFKQNSEKLNNSFVFFMGDHGVRYGPTRLTELGEIEDSNPFLLMSLPASLRSDENLMSTVRNNARQLISQYDMYATFNDIVAPYRPKNDSEPPMYGTSVLKPLPQPRTCDRLRIPFEYCICDYPRTHLPDDAAPGREAATLMVASMNNVLETVDVLKGICEPLNLSSTPVEVETATVEGNLSIFKVTFKVEPGEGHFYGYVSQDHTTSELSILSNRMPRLNSYAATAFCANGSEFAAYCYCSELKKATTTASPTVN